MFLFSFVFSRFIPSTNLFHLPFASPCNIVLLLLCVCYQLFAVSTTDDYLGALGNDAQALRESIPRVTEGWTTFEEVVKLPSVEGTPEGASQQTSLPSVPLDPSASAQPSALPVAELEIYSDFSPAFLASHQSACADKIRRFENFLKVCFCRPSNSFCFVSNLLFSLLVRRCVFQQFGDSEGIKAGEAGRTKRFIEI